MDPWKKFKKSLLCQEKSQKVTVDVRWYLFAVHLEQEPQWKNLKKSLLCQKKIQNVTL